MSFQLCEDTACSTPYPGTLQTLTYNLKVTLADWTTFQRDSTHRGYVPIELDPVKFKQVWTWWLPTLGQANSVVTGDGKVFVTTDNYNSANGLYALSETTGTVQWSKTASNVELDPAAFAKGSVFVKARELNNSMYSYSLWSVDSKDGLLSKRIPLNRGESSFAPTPHGDSVFLEGAGFQGGVTSIAAQDGSIRWTAGDGYGSFSTPAVDGDNVYYYNGSALWVYKRSDGSRVLAIRDIGAPISANSSQSFAAPIRGGSSNVLVLSGTQFTGRAGTSADGYYDRKIINFALDGSNVGPVWSTKDGYLTQPALSQGVVYAGTGQLYTGNGYAARFDAISESTGQVLWSWSPPSPDSSFHRNVVVTKNLAFVSTDTNVYAIDLVKHQAVWHAPFPGALAISPTGLLLISTGAKTSDGRIVAIQLK